MTLSGIQLAAVLKAGMHVSNADGNMDEKEIKILVNELVRFNLTDEVRKTIIKVATEMPVEDMVNHLKQINVEDQKYICGYLAAIILADGEVKDDEINVWKAICTLCEFPEMTAKEALDIWRNN